MSLPWIELPWKPARNGAGPAALVPVKQGFVYACQPSYGPGHKASRRAFRNYPFNPFGKYKDWITTFDDGGGSLLAKSFNEHWKTVLNMQLAGDKVTHFVMLHDDIVPEEFWLDHLLDLILETGADVVSAVSAIKDGRNLTSTGLDDPDDPWIIRRRITMKEIMKLPETFDGPTAANVLGMDSKYNQLLVNTGCWIADMTKPWRYKVTFTIKDRMVFDEVDDKGNSIRIIDAAEFKEGMKGSFSAFCMSEDWNFSRQLNALGCKVLATRAVKCHHMGDMPYPNYMDGMKTAVDNDLRWKFDPTYKDIPKIRGWLYESEGRALAKLAEGRNVLEIGSFCGLSTVWMARTANHVTAVDTFDSRGVPLHLRPTMPADTLHEFVTNLHNYGVEDKVKWIKADVADLPLIMGRANSVEIDGVISKYNLIFIDAEHTYEAVKRDTKIAKSLLADDGIIAFHDYDDKDNAEVSAFIDTDLLNDDNYRIERIAKVDRVLALRFTRRVGVKV